MIFIEPEALDGVDVGGSLQAVFIEAIDEVAVLSDIQRGDASLSDDPGFSAGDTEAAGGLFGSVGLADGGGHATQEVGTVAAVADMVV